MVESRADRRKPLLAVRGVSKRYGPRLVLSEAGFSIFPGEVLGLIGPNGAGKTTLFECLAGPLTCESGSVQGADGLPVSRRRRSETLFYTPDGFAPWPDQTVGALLSRFAALWGSSGRVGELGGALGLRPFGKNAVRSLSKGERRRFLLALGLLAPRPLVLLDEP